MWPKRRQRNAGARYPRADAHRIKPEVIIKKNARSRPCAILPRAQQHPDAGSNAEMRSPSRSQCHKTPPSSAMKPTVERGCPYTSPWEPGQVDIMCHLEDVFSKSDFTGAVVDFRLARRHVTATRRGIRSASSGTATEKLGPDSPARLRRFSGGWPEARFCLEAFLRLYLGACAGVACS